MSKRKRKSFLNFKITSVLVMLVLVLGAIYYKTVLSVRASVTPNVSMFVPSESTFVYQKSPNYNFKTLSYLNIQNDPTAQAKSLIRFNISGIPDGAVINSASLKLYVSNGSVKNGSADTAGFIASVQGTWSSSTVTWKNAPAQGAKISNLEPHSSAIPGEWRSADVSSVVSGNGTYDFYVVSDSLSYDNIYYASAVSTLKSAGISPSAPTISVTWSYPSLSSITHGPIVGGVTDNSAKIFVRVGTSDQVRIEYSTNPVYDGSTVTTTDWIVPQANQDFTAIASLANLQSDTKYYYWVTIGSPPANTEKRYEFVTFPSSGTVKDFTFSVFSDAASQDSYAPGYAKAASMNPAFVGQIGDFRHQNPAAVPTPITINNWWIQNKESIGEGFAGTDFSTNIGAKFPFFHIWDDHDFCDNNADKTCAYKDTFSKPAFLSYFPTYSLDAGDGTLGQSFRYGKEAEIFVLDLRYQRSPSTDLDGPSKSIMGNSQKVWLKSKLLAAQNDGVIWKFLVSSSIWNDHSKPGDSWSSYLTEQNELINYIKNNGIKNVVVISGDLHSGGAIDDGSNTVSCSIGWCIPEISVPHTNVYNQNYCTGSKTGGTKDCGTWAIGFLNAKASRTVSNAGFANFTVTPQSVLMRVIREDGKVNLSYTVTAK